MTLELSNVILMTGKNDHGNFQGHFNDRRKMTMENSNVSFFRELKMTMEISNAIFFAQTQNDHGNAKRHFIDRSKITMETSITAPGLQLQISDV